MNVVVIQIETQKHLLDQQLEAMFDLHCDRQHRVYDLSEDDPTEEIVDVICDLMGKDHVDDLIAKATALLEKRLLKLCRTERMLERLIDLQLEITERSHMAAMFHDIAVQHSSIRKKLLKQGVLKHDRSYSVKELIQLDVFGKRR